MAHVTHSTVPQPAEHHHSAMPYVLVWVVLLVLTGLTWFTGQMHLPTWGLYIALLIATTKAVLVVLFFMHLYEQKGVNRVTFAATLVFVIIMLLGVMGDIGFRLPTLLPQREGPISEAALESGKATARNPGAQPGGEPAHGGHE